MKDNIRTKQIDRMYPTRFCHSYTEKVNIYEHPAFIRVPTCPYPRPQPVPLYFPVGQCGQAYPTPSYAPPAPYCHPTQGCGVPRPC
jgi:hypothetical protein